MSKVRMGEKRGQSAWEGRDGGREEEVEEGREATQRTARVPVHQVLLGRRGEDAEASLSLEGFGGVSDFSVQAGDALLWCVLLLLVVRRAGGGGSCGGGRGGHGRCHGE